MTPSPGHPQTPHGAGERVFVAAGAIIGRKSLFRPEML